MGYYGSASVGGGTSSPLSAPIVEIRKLPDISALPGVKYVGDAPRAHVISFLVHIELVYNIKGALAQRGRSG